MKIPIANAFRLLAYAWDVVEEVDARVTGVEGLEAPVDALGHALAGAAGDLIRRGLRREYRESDRITPGIRGKLLIGPTVKRNLLSAARTECRVSELSEDTPANRIIRATVRSVLTVNKLDTGVRSRLEDVETLLSGVPLAPLRLAALHRIPIHRNNGLYRLVLSICRLIQESLIADERSGRATFRDFRRDRRFMWRMFERFVYRFFEREQALYRVMSPKLSWAGLTGFDSDLRHVPEMRTDIVLRSPSRTLIVDTKFYGQAMALNRFGGRTIRSGHLYQLVTYLSQFKASASWQGEMLDGMLLYPVVDRPFDLRYEIGGLGVRACSIDLRRPWPEIRQGMVAILEAWRSATSSEMSG